MKKTDAHKMIKPCLFCDSTGKFTHALGIFVIKAEDFQKVISNKKDGVCFDLCPGCKGSGYHYVGPSIIERHE